ncbi:LacI family DNA-binding transcriptional regulator [Arthrobacter russicus]|jgi:LacI family transcriptional regulator|uniref:LacI family transcriptional regulator n=1 Tax=Arthrobacter russicus TaxID=172040 RepID=A0ABU1JDS4_9MICC|nr:LacI family DNA-binding transcriptional regulator [Arthrobacter russicus]MDR6270525.1 LacI family transcriptional regulator [Arthrobacter russicus]
MPETPSRSKATRNDVAALAGVSTAVVSYVVNNGPKRVAEETAIRVRQAIEMLDYRPNAVARSLKTGSIKTLGLVIPDGKNPYFMAVSTAVEAAARQRGYVVLSASSNLDPDVESAHLNVFEARGVDGVLLSSCVQGAALTGQAIPGLPMVFLDRSTAAGINTVGVESRAGAFDAVQHLIEHGRQRIGLIIGEDEYVTGDRDRISGWRDALGAAGLPEGPVEFGDFSLSGGYSAGVRMFARSDRPDGLFVSSDQQSIGVLRAAWEAGMRIPADVALVSFDGIAESAFTCPALTTVQQPIGQLAEAAVDLVLRTAQQSSEIAHLRFSGDLAVRESCGCVN